MWKHSGFTVAVAAWAVVAWAGPARAEPPPIEYAYPDQSVWTTVLDAQGLPANPLIKAADAIFTRAGLKWGAHPYPAARMFETLRNGTANFSMLVKSPALDQCCLVGRNPIASTELQVLRSPGKPTIRQRQDFRGKSVILLRGYSYGGLLAELSAPDSGVTVYSAVNRQAAFVMLEHGRADYLLDYAGPIAEILAGRPDLDLRRDTLDRLEVFLVLSRAYPDAEATLARLEAIADELNLDTLPGAPKD
ncbi:MAG TPA: amino acid ABC transporter [Magnetospirillum sp.]|nr:amino acid ABC transporter [Magnetospirillum sp.]